MTGGEVKPDGASVFIDSNILIYAYAFESPFCEAARGRLDFLRSSRVELWISQQTVTEFLAVTTRVSRDTGNPLRAQILSYVGKFTTEFNFAIEDQRTADELGQLLLNVPVFGRQVHDANIVATMLAHGVDSLLTHNEADFRRYEPLISILPLQN